MSPRADIHLDMSELTLPKNSGWLRGGLPAAALIAVSALVLAPAADPNFPLDISDTSVNPDPFGLSLSTTGSGLKLDSESALFFNLFFPQPSPANPALDFQAGDDLGSVGLSVKVR
jgi:hypothetical protein